MALHNSKRYIIVLIMLLGVQYNAHADLNSDMQNWFDEIQSYGNVTAPGIVEGQTRNVLTGGSLYMRNPAKNYQIYSVSPPDFKAGCGGIDLYLGSFSFINTDQFVSMLRNIGNNALGYAFEMAVCTISPDICDYLKYLQDQIAKINSMNINSCKAAEGIVMAAQSAMTENKEESLSRTLGTMWNDFTDAFESYDKWRQDAQTRRSLREKAVSTSDAFKEKLKPGNIVWNAMQKTDINDNDLKQAIMSMIGTVIIIPSAENGDHKGYARYEDDTKIRLKDIVGNGQTDKVTLKILACDETSECMQPTMMDRDIKPFAVMVKEKITRMIDNVKSRSGQSQDDLKLIAISPQPIWKLISMMAETPGGDIFLSNYYEIIAADIAYSYYTTMINQINRAMRAKLQQEEPDIQNAVQQLLSNIDRKKTEVREDYREMSQRAVDISQLQQYAAFLQSNLMATLPTQVSASMKAFKIAM